jgi:predicted kinase
MKKKNLKITILIGIPASGKSTWSKDYIRNNADTVRVNRDDFRLMLKSAQMTEPKIEDMITTLVDATITQSLLRKCNVLVDATNLKVGYIKSFIEKFKYSADIDYRVFDISLEKALERDAKREATVGEAVIKKLYKDYKILMDSFDFQPVTKTDRKHLTPNFESKLEDAVIFDIDGTLALMGKRGPFDWDDVYKDSINEIVAEQLAFHKSKGRKILVVTGRDGVCRKVTEDWLDLHELEYDEMFMRPNDDYRKDTAIKKEIYLNEIKDKYNVLSVYDDRLSVCKAWNELGLYVFTVNQGIIEF